MNIYMQFPTYQSWLRFRKQPVSKISLTSSGLLHYQTWIRLQYLGKRVLRQTGIQNSIGDLVTVYEGISIVNSLNRGDSGAAQPQGYSRNLIGVTLTD
jgi:hypothetical protein